MNASQRISRVLYVPEINSADTQPEKERPRYEFKSPHQLPFGNYIAWLREHTANGPTSWTREEFQLDDDHDPSTSLPELHQPIAPSIRVIREGQGFAGHAVSESRIAWTSDAQLHDVWMNQQEPDGRWTVHRRIRNVPGTSMSLATLQSAAESQGYSFFGQADRNSTSSLDSGKYRIFVRGVNTAVDTNDQWVGAGSWSAGFDFSFTKLEGEAARPAALSVQHDLNPTIEWATVTDAEYYLVSLWKGPDYLSNRPVIFRSHQPRIQFSAGRFVTSAGDIQLEPGNQVFVKVRAVGQDGTTELFTATNHQSTTIKVPDVSSVVPQQPVIVGPSSHLSAAQVLLRWQNVPNAASYEVWLSSVDLNRRVFLAENVTSSSLLLSLDLLGSLVNEESSLAQYVNADGLVPGRYRYWVRAVSPTFTQMSDWSSAFRFDVAAEGNRFLDLNHDVPIARIPLVAPNLVLPFETEGRSFLLVANGKGESFGASVLAVLEIDGEGNLSRPVLDLEGGSQRLKFPDLSVGSNVSEMKRLSDGRIVVLSRGSSELRVIDLQQWQIQAHRKLVDDASVNYPDAIGMEILSNDQIAVVFNRSDRLRLFQVGSDGNFIEEISSGGGDSAPGFLLEAGRGVQLSSVPIGAGVFRLFVATPGLAAVVVYHFDSVNETLTMLRGESGRRVIFQRSEVANPFHGGALGIVGQTGTEETELFYFSADRSGFLTWINVASLKHGFIDLAQWMPSVDRSPASENYANPNDNSFDSTRVLSLDGSRLVVFSSRQESTLLRLETSADGQLRVVDGAELPRGYSGTLTRRNGADVIVSTAVAPFSRNRQLSQLTLTQISFDQSDGASDLTPVVLTTFTTANPVVAAQESKGGLLVQRTDASLEFISHHPTEGSLQSRLVGNIIFNGSGTEYALTPDLFATFESAETQQDYVFASAVRGSGEVTEVEPVLLILEWRQDDSLNIIRTVPLDSLKALQSLSVSSSRLVVLDRLGGQMLVVRDWMVNQPAIDPVYDFRAHVPSEFGAIRPARSVILSDGTIVIVHDTFPDRGISVFDADSWQPNNRSQRVFHANTTGTFSFDAHQLDKDRVVSVNYGGDVVVKNIRTGAWELDDSSNVISDAARLFAVENTSFGFGQLVINSPSAQTVLVLEIQPDADSLNLQVLGLHQVVDAISTVATDDGYWIVGANTVRKVLTKW